MARFDIISKDGSIVRYSGKPRYIGSYLKPSYLEFNEISSPTPIAWEVGDYVDYPRTGMRYRLYSLPQPSKNARKGTHGKAFTYSGVQLHASTKELEIAPFRDLAANDNGIHFSTSPDVATFEDVYGIARRIQACMDDLYPNRWEIRVTDFDAAEDAETIEKISEAKDFALSGGTCLDALSKIYELWQDIGWIHSYENGVEVITIGYANKRMDANTSDAFLYGKGNGLTAIKRNQTNKDEFATRLYVYGSERNLISRYYNSLAIANAESVDIRNLMLPLDVWDMTDGLPDARKAYLENAEAVAKYGVIPKTHYFDNADAGADIYPSIERMTIGQIREVLADMGQMQYYPDEGIYLDNSERVDEVLSAINPTDSGVLNADGKRYEETIEAYIKDDVTIAIPAQSTDEVKAFYSTRILANVTFAREGKGTVSIAQNMNCVFIGEGIGSIRAQFVMQSADGLYTQTKEVTATAVNDTNWTLPIPSMHIDYDKKDYAEFQVFITMQAWVTPTEGDERSVLLKLPTNALAVHFNTLFPKYFTIDLKQIGFDIETQASKGEGKVISMKSGMCAGRNFVITSCQYQSDTDSWRLTCARQKDDTLGLLFPYKDYPIASGDRFVLLEIAMPETYIRVAMERLLTEGQKLLAKASKVQTHYEPSIDAKVMVESGRTLREGMYMEITDEDVVDNGTDYILIDTLNINEDDSAIPTYKVTLKERRKVTYKGTPSVTSSTSTSSAVEGSEDVDIDLSAYATKEYVDGKIAPLEGMFYFADENTIGTKYNFFSEQQNAAGGIGEPETGEGAGGVIVDSQMSDESENAVQNKVIKEYIDNADNALEERITVLEQNGGGGTEGGEGDKYYFHSQDSAQAEWTIEHNLGKYPSVTVVDSAGTVVFGDVTYESDSRLKITFSAEFSGKAYLN